MNIAEHSTHQPERNIVVQGYPSNVAFAASWWRAAKRVDVDVRLTLLMPPDQSYDAVLRAEEYFPVDFGNAALGILSEITVSGYASIHVKNDAWGEMLLVMVLLGFLVRREDHYVMALPAPPTELQISWALNTVVDIIVSHSNYHPVFRLHTEMSARDCFPNFTQIKLALLTN